MHLHIGFLEFFVFGLYFIIWKGIWHFVNIEARRKRMTTVAGVSGLFA